MKRDRVAYTLTIVDAGGDGHGDPLLRLRALLKAMLRGYHYRCKAIAEVKAEGATGTTERPGQVPTPDPALRGGD